MDYEKEFQKYMNSEEIMQRVKANAEALSSDFLSKVKALKESSNPSLKEVLDGVKNELRDIIRLESDMVVKNLSKMLVDFSVTMSSTISSLLFVKKTPTRKTVPIKKKKLVRKRKKK